MTINLSYNNDKLNKCYLKTNIKNVRKTNENNEMGVNNFFYKFNIVSDCIIAFCK